MIIVSGLNRKNGEVRTQKYPPGREGLARRYREYLRSVGYNTVLVNDVKEMYRDRARRAAEDRRAARDAFDEAKEQPFTVEDISGYQLHSMGTGRGNMKGLHIKDSGTDTLTGAIKDAEKKVSKWQDTHKGIVIYRAIKLVRKIVKPTTEVVELA
jgi:hypothetical protein